MSKLFIYIALSTIALGGTAFAGTVYVDTFEDLGPRGTAVTSRVIGGVTVTILPNAGTLMSSSYDLPGPGGGFWGKNGAPHPIPLDRDNVSGSKFITGDLDRGIHFDGVTPLQFLLSDPVLSFGLTTLDVLEAGHRTDYFVTLEAFDAAGNSLGSQTRRGPQGASGLDLDWRVSVPAMEISRVVLDGNFYTGFGIDDLLVELDDQVGTGPIPSGSIAVPLPSAVWLGLGLMGVLGAVRRIRRARPNR